MSDTNEPVRVRLTKSDPVIETTMGRSSAESAEGVQILDDVRAMYDATTPVEDTAKDSRPLKPHTSVDEEASKKPAARPGSDK